MGTPGRHPDPWARNRGQTLGQVLSRPLQKPVVSTPAPTPAGHRAGVEIRPSAGWQDAPRVISVGELIRNANPDSRPLGLRISQ